MEFSTEGHEEACQLFIQAARCGDMDTVMALWGDGSVVDIDCRSDDEVWGRTALHFAAYNEHIDIAQFLVVGWN
jgi:hypothetical protein